MSEGRTWRGSILNPGAAIGVGQNCLWTTPDNDTVNANGKVIGFCCMNPDHQDDPCEANDHGGWMDMAEMLRYAADSIKPGCQVAFMVEPQSNVESAPKEKQ